MNSSFDKQVGLLPRIPIIVLQLNLAMVKQLMVLVDHGHVRYKTLPADVGWLIRCKFGG